MWSRRGCDSELPPQISSLPSSFSISVSQCLVAVTPSIQQGGTEESRLDQQDHLTTTAILPHQEKQARDGLSASAAFQN